MKAKPNVKYVEQFIHSELERRSRKLIASIQEEGCSKDCGQHARRLLGADIMDAVMRANDAIDKEAELLGFSAAKHAVIDYHDYWVNQFHAPEYWEAEERVTKIRSAIHDLTSKLSLKVAMGMTAEELERELDAIDFYEISRK